MDLTDKHCILYIQELLKSSRLSKHFGRLELKAYENDKRLCVTIIKEYVERTKLLRGNDSCFLISFQKPHKPIFTDTIGRWLKKVLAKSAFTCFSNHSFYRIIVDTISGTIKESFERAISPIFSDEEPEPEASQKASSSRQHDANNLTEDYDKVSLFGGDIENDEGLLELNSELDEFEGDNNSLLDQIRSGHVNTELSYKRRELMKFYLNPEFKPLCSRSRKSGQLLFGNDLPKTLQELKTTNKS
ncbi:predicted protein [Nematostella vectensis]|uniref:Uncharacterized protein n=1 Tax=Nematostella vectensis TaxID=45351 RepID=A7SDM5_NEMVE|nr:predicted protein [Nematostella vectensis]|eukprot:XP_001630253.1 predicted protein [Nematostella vectensis]